MGDLFKNTEKQKDDKPVFDVTTGRNADIEEELERRKRQKDEQQKWMNPPVYFKITEPVVPWEEVRYPDMPEELHDLMREILNDNSRMTRSHFGKLKDAVQAAANAQGPEMKELRLAQLLIAGREYLETSTSKTNKRRVTNCKKLVQQLTDYRRKAEIERERVEKKNAGDDKDAQTIVRMSEALESLKKDSIRPYPADGSEEQISAYKKEISGMGMFFSMRYNKLISACDVYLSKKKKPQVAREHYKAIKEKAEAELKIFNNALTDFLIENSTRREISWGDALIMRTGSVIRLDTSKERDMGAGTSTVYRIERGTSGYDYFKAEERIGENIEDCWDQVYKRFNVKGALTAEQENCLKMIDEALREDIKELGKDPKTKEQKERTFYSDFVENSAKTENFYGNFASDDEGMEKIVKSRTYKIYKTLRRLESRYDTDVDFIVKVMNAFDKSFNCYRIATKAAKIKEGSILSTRNVATYRMAVALGIEESVSRSETAQIEKDGIEVYGNLMQEAKGKKAISAAGRSRKYTYSAKCVSDMAMMQVFDLICGQVDRNGTNYFVTTDESSISSIRMIDNDMAFGDIRPEELAEGNLRLPPFDMQLIPAMPAHFKRRILELDRKGVTLLLEDLLTVEEIDAAVKRLEFIKEKIRDYDREQEKKARSAEASDKLKTKCMQYEEYRSYVYQLHVRERLEQERQKFMNREITRLPAMGNISYLMDNNIPDTETLKQKIEDFENSHKKE
ncbi:MAG: hypothetical protein IKR23_08000 [Lachnospiraceae bacterium]|nr:hypothetical protein [Lachnospiraceae bacterium]